MSWAMKEQNLKRHCLLLAILLHVKIPTCDSVSSYAKSISDLENLERFDLLVAESLSNVFLSADGLPNNTIISEEVHSYLQDFYESNGYKDVNDAIANKEIRASKNPICAYRLVRRVTVLLEHLISWKEFSRFFGSTWRQIAIFLEEQKGWPTITDLEILGEKILRLQLVYDLNVDQLANGWVSSVQTNCTLNSQHCYEISNVATVTEQFASAIEWLEVAKEKALLDRKFSIPFIETALWNAIEKHNMELDEEIIMELQPLFFNTSISHVSGASKSATKLRNLQYEAFKGRKENTYAHLNYMGVCAGANHQTEQEKSRLFCWYEFKIHPVFTIGPMKIEFLSHNPDIVQIYEVLQKEEMENLISECTPLIHNLRHKTLSYQYAPSKVEVTTTSYHRSSLFAWCEPSTMKNIDKKLARFTGLEVEGNASERFFFVSYSVGGHLNPHFDRPFGMEVDTNNPFRIASMTFYLSDVEEGGETVFTSVGVKAKPVKGSAVLWFNFFTDGTEDFSSYHGGCPVLLGSKWAANKWIKYGSQFLNWKCGLKQKERFKVAVNKIVH